ncbi:hypothetical protein BV20DRAFT_1037610 [Pilatotrama ljubarskyi]|nr:hypothetical protein BV20DRAFT_1037610 [Pilatotrama ljubarskyi]
MKRGDAKSPFPPSCLASPQEVKAFNAGDNHCCDKENFKIDISNGALNRWNTSASMVFARAFVECGRFDCDDQELIAEAFRTHVRTLRKNFLRQAEEEHVRKTAEKKARREQRKSTLFYRRRRVAAKYSQLKPHLPMLEQLGIDGMSSDESDEDSNGCKLFRILAKSWRPDRVTAWLRGFDAVDALTRDAQSSRGNQPRRRAVSSKVDDSRAAVKGLPKNAYNPVWYAKLGDFVREALCRSEDTYSFEHCESVLR